MSGALNAGSYRRLLADPTIARTFLLASVGRCGYAVLPLLLLFTVSQATRSFSAAALSMSVFGLSTLAMPAKSRLVDRLGQRPVLVPLAVAELLVLAAAAVAAARPIASVTSWFGLAAAAGLAAPPLGPSMRAQWRRFAPDHLDVAYSLDAVAEEVLWLIGPLVAGVVLAVGPARHGLLLPPVLVLVGALALATSPAQHRSGSESAHHRRQGALRHGRLWPILGLMSAFGASGGLLVTGLAARANAGQRPAFVGVAEAAIAVGAVTGGLIWGRLPHRWPWPRAASLLLLHWAILVGGSVFTGLGPWLVAILVLAGGVGAPLWVIAYVAADGAVPAHVRTEASTWVSTATNLATSVGTALAGLLAARYGPLTPAAAAAALALAAGLAIVVLARTRIGAGMGASRPG